MIVEVVVEVVRDER